jgi:predicted nucleic acid-binding Zn ribbon protein
MNTNNRKDLQAISALLPRVARQQGWQRQLDRHSLFLHWDALVGQPISSHAHPLKIVNNVLWLEIANSAWMQELQFQKLQLLETLNKTLRVSRLKDIRFTLADSDTSKERPEPSVHFSRPAPAATEAFQHQIASIEDEKIRDALMNLWYQSHSCRRS